MQPRTITITVGDYQRLEQKWLVDLATARRESVVYERRMGELERELEAMQAELDRTLARAEAADQALRQLSREGVTPVTAFEASVVVVAILVLVALVVLRVRSGDAPAIESLPLPISGGAVGHELVEVHTRLDDVMATLSVIREDILRRPAGAAPLGTAPPKPHRPQFMLTSEERNNKVLRKIYTCRVEGCPDTLIDEEPEPVLQRSPD